MGALVHLVDIGGDQCSKGREFKSPHLILHGYFFKLIFCQKNYCWFEKTNNKWKRGRGWAIEKVIVSHVTLERYVLKSQCLTRVSPQRLWRYLTLSEQGTKGKASKQIEFRKTDKAKTFLLQFLLTCVRCRRCCRRCYARWQPVWPVVGTKSNPFFQKVVSLRPCYFLLQS